MSRLSQSARQASNAAGEALALGLAARRRRTHSISSAMITGVRPTCTRAADRLEVALASTMQPSLARGGRL